MQQLVGSNLALAFFILTCLVNSGRSRTGTLEMLEIYFSGTSSESTGKLGTCALEQLESTHIRQFQHSRHNRESTDAPRLSWKFSMEYGAVNTAYSLMVGNGLISSVPHNGQPRARGRRASQVHAEAIVSGQY